MGTCCERGSLRKDVSFDLQESAFCDRHAHQRRASYDLRGTPSYDPASWAHHLRASCVPRENVSSVDGRSRTAPLEKRSAQAFYRVRGYGKRAPRFLLLALCV